MNDRERAWQLIGSGDVPSDEVFVGRAVLWLYRKSGRCEIVRFGEQAMVFCNGHEVYADTLTDALAALVIAAGGKPLAATT